MDQCSNSARGYGEVVGGYSLNRGFPCKQVVSLLRHSPNAAPFSSVSPPYQSCLPCACNTLPGVFTTPRVSTTPCAKGDLLGHFFAAGFLCCRNPLIFTLVLNPPSLLPSPSLHRVFTTALQALCSSSTHAAFCHSFLYNLSTYQTFYQPLQQTT